MPHIRNNTPHGHRFVQWLSFVSGRLYHQGKWLGIYPCVCLCLCEKASNSTTCGFLLVCTLPTTPHVWPSMSKSFTLEISGWPFLFFIYPKEEIRCYQVVLWSVSARQETASQWSLSRSSSCPRWKSTFPLLTPEAKCSLLVFIITLAVKYTQNMSKCHVQRQLFPLYFKGVNIMEQVEE